MLFQEFFKVIFHYTGNLSCSLGDVSSIFSGFEIFVSVLQKNGAMRIFRDLGVSVFLLAAVVGVLEEERLLEKVFQNCRLANNSANCVESNSVPIAERKILLCFFLLPKVLAKLNGKVTFFLRPWLRRQTQLCEWYKL